MGKSVRPEDCAAEPSMEELVLEQENRLYRVALAILGNRADAEDMVQETFVKYVEKRPAFASPEHRTAWLVRVTVNHCKSRRRSAWWRRTVPLLDSCPADTPEEGRVMEAIMALPPKYRTVIHLFYYEGYSTAEIASLTGDKASTVRSLLTRARQKLRGLVEEE